MKKKFLAVILSAVMFAGIVPVSAYAEESTLQQVVQLAEDVSAANQPDAQVLNSDGILLRQESSAGSVGTFSLNSLYTKLLDGIISTASKKIGTAAADFGIEHFLLPVVDYFIGLPEEEQPEDPNVKEILQDLDKISAQLELVLANQDKMMDDLSDISHMVECEQLNTVLNNFQQLKNGKVAPQVIYDSIKREENNTALSDEDRSDLIKSILLGAVGLGTDIQVYNRTDLAFDNYTYQLGQAIIGPYRVTLKTDSTVKNESGNIFWILYELERREVDWEFMADEERATFHADLMSQYMIAALLDIQSMDARIAAIEKYNANRDKDKDPLVSDSPVREMRDQLLKQMEQVSKLAKQWDVQPHDYSFFWVPGHEIKIMSYVKCGSFYEKHQANDAAGIDSNLALDDPNSYFSEYMQYDDSHPLMEGQKLADLYKFASKSGRLKSYYTGDHADQGFWKWLCAEGNIQIDPKVDTMRALCAPIGRDASQTYGMQYSYDYSMYERLYYIAFAPHWYAAQDEKYYDQWATVLSYGERRHDYWGILTPKYEYDSSELDKFNFMIIGAVANYGGTETVLTEIEISSDPAKTTYKPGETFDPAGMVVTAKYSDGTERGITDFTVTPDEPLTKQDAIVTISYTENGKTKTAEIPITVKESSGKGSSGGGGRSGKVSYTLTYDTNGGSEIKAEICSVGDNITLDKTPEKEGYTFTGWYGDKELTQKITSVVMNSSKTVYAGWDNGEQPVIPDNPETPDENAPLMVIRIDDTKYQLNGKNMELDSAPFIDENDRTMLPVRVVANALGISDADIVWDDNTKTASFTRPDGKVVSCTVGSNIIKIGDEEVEIDTAPVIRNDRIYLPMRALFNAFNVSDDHIAWDGAARKVTVAKEALDDINALTEVAPVEEEPVEEVLDEETPAAETPVEKTPAEEA
ncbi:MAG: InlB B-repeat-containing protein [Firmicutes bacterium]|nr:InlB B-repeat-containing protein [Bacillota bacterium]